MTQLKQHASEIKDDFDHSGLTGISKSAPKRNRENDDEEDDPDEANRTPKRKGARASQNAQPGALQGTDPNGPDPNGPGDGNGSAGANAADGDGQRPGPAPPRPGPVPETSANGGAVVANRNADNTNAPAQPQAEQEEGQDASLPRFFADGHLAFTEWLYNAEGSHTSAFIQFCRRELDRYDYPNVEELGRMARALALLNQNTLPDHDWENEPPGMPNVILEDGLRRMLGEVEDFKLLWEDMNGIRRPWPNVRRLFAMALDESADCQRYFNRHIYAGPGMIRFDANAKAAELITLLQQRRIGRPGHDWEQENDQWINVPHEEKTKQIHLADIEGGGIWTVGILCTPGSREYLTDVLLVSQANRYRRQRPGSALGESRLGWEASASKYATTKTGEEPHAHIFPTSALSFSLLGFRCQILKTSSTR